MSARPRILLVLDDAMLRQSVAEHLAQAAGMVVTEAAHGDSALAQAGGHDLVVVDEALDGLALSHRLRHGGFGMPVVMLGAQGAIIPSGCGIEAVLAKPLRLSVLVARLQDILARRPEAAEIRIGPWRFESARGLLLATDGSQTRLTGKEAAILTRLGHADGAVVGREVLLDEVWGYGAGISTHTLETHIYRLRRKLGGDLLVTEGGGYRLTKES